MHRVRRGDVFPADEPHTSAERLLVDGDSAPHSHDFLELAVVASGSATHVSAAGEQGLARGSVVLVRPGDWHGYRDCRDLIMHNVYVEPEVFRRELAWLRGEPRVGRLLQRSGHVSRLTATALAVVEAALPATTPRSGHVTRLGALLCLLDGAAAALAPVTQARSHPAVLLAVQEMESEPARDWTVGALAALARVSPAHLARMFTGQLGVAPMAYLNRMRAERAAAMLIESDLPVAVIGRLVGWSDPNYASRRFRHFFGMSPSAYRARFSLPS